MNLYFFLTIIATLLLISLSIYKFIEFTKFNKSRILSGKEIINIDPKDRRKVIREINKLRQDYSDWDLFILADRFSWPVETISCLPKLYFAKKSKVSHAIIWKEVIKLLPPDLEYIVMREYCLGQAFKISMSKKTYDVVNEIALNLEEARLHNPYPSYTSMLGVINQFINTCELEAKRTNNRAFADLLKKERKEFLKDELNLRLTSPT